MPEVMAVALGVGRALLKPGGGTKSGARMAQNGV
jgi:hypothetical protein